MLENYTYREGQSISVSEIQEDIYKFIEDASCLPVLGRLVKYALPWVKKVKMTIEVDALKKQAYVYKNCGVSVCASDLTNWDDLKKYVPPSCSSCKWTEWSVSQLTENFVEWVSVSIVDKCNGQKIIREVKVYKDFTFEIVCWPEKSH